MTGVQTCALSDLIIKPEDPTNYDARLTRLIQTAHEKDYAVRFAADARPVWAIGLNISKDCRTIEEYRIVQVK